MLSLHKQVRANIELLGKTQMGPVRDSQYVLDLVPPPTKGQDQSLIGRTEESNG